MVSKNVKARITEHFFFNPTTRLRVRHIEREVGVPLPSAIRYAKELVQEGILKRTVISGVTFYSADRVSKRFLLEKRLFNMKQLFSCGLVDFLVSEHINPTIVLFGSYSRGEDVESSDSDIYLEGQTKEHDLSRFEKRLHRKIQVFFYKNIKKVENKELANNVLNGTVLNGFVDVF